MSASDKANDKDFVMHNSDPKESEFDDFKNLTYEIDDEFNHKLFSMPLIIAAVGFLILIILLIFVISRGQDLAEKKQISAIEERLDKLEAVFTLKLDQVTKALNRLDETIASKQAPPAKVPSPPKKEQNEVKPKIHKVQAGDSLYQISRHYGLTLDQLRSYNKLEPDSKIYPGQELKLTP